MPRPAGAPCGLSEQLLTRELWPLCSQLGRQAWGWAARPGHTLGAGEARCELTGPEPPRGPVDVSRCPLCGFWRLCWSLFSSPSSMMRKVTPVPFCRETEPSAQAGPARGRVGPPGSVAPAPPGTASPSPTAPCGPAPGAPFMAGSVLRPPALRSADPCLPWCSAVLEPSLGPWSPGIRAVSPAPIGKDTVAQGLLPMLTASDSRLLGRLAAPFSFPVCFALTAVALGFPGFWLPPLSRPVLPASLGSSTPYASLHGLPGPHRCFCTDACLTA